jgi:hypothetical protein
MPSYAEIGNGEQLSDTGAVAEDLQAIDWAFTTDDTGYL